MMRILATAAIAATVGSMAFEARAGIEACGDIEIEASAECVVMFEGGCTVMCEPIHFTAACYAECSGGCQGNITASCQAECSADCYGACEVNPGSFSCQGSCEANCKADCGGVCAAEADQALCRGSCEATCDGECAAYCQGTPPSASCEAKCEASCSGECSAEASLDCQIDCQGGCAANLQGGCVAECQSPEGALFCDGQYIDHGGKLEECINALKALLDIEVTYSASGSAECVGNQCVAEGEASCSCSHVHTPRATFAWLGLALVGGALFVGRRRRR